MNVLTNAEMVRWLGKKVISIGDTMKDIQDKIRKIHPKGTIKIISVYKAGDKEYFRVNVYASSGLSNKIDTSYFVKKSGETITL